LLRLSHDGTHADFEDFVEEGREFSARAGRAAKPASSLKIGTIVMLILAWLAVGAPLAVQVFFCKFREGDCSVVVITLSG